MQTISLTVLVNDHGSASLRSIGSSADHTSSKMRTLGKVGAAAMRGLGAAAVVGAAALAFGAKAAADDQASHRQLAIQLKNTTGARAKDIAAVEDWITKTEMASGVADDDLRASLGKLVTATGNVTSAQKLLSLAMDVSAGTGKSLDSVTMALVKAQNGSVGGLSRLGVATKDAAGKTKDFATIQEELAQKFKGQTAAAATTATGQYNRLKVMLNETAESIGYKLLPYAVKLGSWILNTGIPAAQQFGNWLKSHLGPAISQLGSFFKSSSKEGGDLSNAFKDLKDFAGSAKRVFDGLKPLLSDLATDVLPLLVMYFRGFALEMKALGRAAIFMWNNAVGPAMKFMFQAFQRQAVVSGTLLKILGKAPGMGWADKLGQKLLDAADKAEQLANDIRDIPTHHDVAINVTTHYTSTGKPVPAAPGVQVGRHSGHGGNIVPGIGPNGIDVLEQIVPGIQKLKKSGSKVLDLVKQDYDDKKQKVQDLIQASNDFADSFKAWAKSIFSLQSEEGQAPLSIQDILNAQHGQEAQSGQVLSDVRKVINMGLSKDLVEQLQASGDQGAETLHLLAQASQDQIDELNRSNSQTMANYGAAGMKAADKIYDAQIQQAQSNLAISASLVDAISAIKNLEKVEFVVKGDDLVAVIKKKNKDKGNG